MTAYAARGDVYRYGLPRGALGNPGRLVESALALNSVVTLNEHGFETGDPVTFRASDGGTLSAPLVAGTVYYVIRLTDSTFQASATPTGGPITLTTDSTSVLVTADLPIDALLERYSRWVDGFLPAHAVPLTAPYPVQVTAVVAELTARKAQILSGMTSESMREAFSEAKGQVERWLAGQPLRNATPAQRTNLAAVTSRRDDRIGVPLFGVTRGSDPSDNGGFFQ